MVTHVVGTVCAHLKLMLMVRRMEGLAGQFFSLGKTEVKMYFSYPSRDVGETEEMCAETVGVKGRKSCVSLV